MDKIIDYLQELITKQVKDFGIVVWYDPEKHYQGIVKTLNTGARLFNFNDSFFELKYQLEPMLDGITPPKMLVYVAKERSETDNALIEIEKAGCVLEPGHPSINQNTRLEVVARAVLKPIMPDAAETICKQIASGSLTYDDVEGIAEHGAEIGSGTVKLIFGSIDPVEIAYLFLTKPEIDDNIVKKNAVQELQAILKNSFGFDMTDKIPDKTRERFVRYVLLGDLVNNIDDDGIPSVISQMDIPSLESHKQNTSKLAQRWRSDIEHKDSYVDVSKTVDQKCHVAAFSIPPEKLVKSQTFLSTESKLIDWACKLILENALLQATQLVDAQKDSFWPRTEETLMLKWSILETVVSICIKTGDIKKELKGKKYLPKDLIKNYCRTTLPWYELDRFHRELEHRYERYNIDLSDENSPIEKVIAKARQFYTNMAGDLAEFLQDSEFPEFGFGFQLQRDTFSREVKPLVGKHKIAYIWVDALRYEMAAELVSGFGPDFHSELKPAIATIPGITEMGMASLLPGAEENFAILENKGKLAVRCGDTIITTRQDRVNYLTKNLKGQVVEAKIEALQKPRKKLRDQIAASNFILVTSQEIDEICEQGNTTLAHRIMQDILEQIRRAIVNLSVLGVDTFIVTADHGYIFLDEIEPSNKMQKPGGEELALHRRAWIGNGGQASNAYIRLKESDVGLSGNYDLVFPRRIACFMVKGPENPYFHGGISLQEMVVPIIKITKTEVVPLPTAPEIKIILEKAKITNRLFSVQLVWKSPAQRKLLGTSETKKRVRVAVKSGKNDVGEAVHAVYGYEDGTKDIILEQNKPNLVTIMLTGEPAQNVLYLVLVDAETLVELARLENIVVNLII